MIDKKEQHEWTVAIARRRFSELLMAAARAPQRVFNRKRLVGVVVDAKTFEQFERWRRRRHQGGLARGFDELRQICQEEGYTLKMPKRADRQDSFSEVLDELSV